MATRHRRRISGLLTTVLVASGLAGTLVAGQGPAVAAEGSLVCTVGPSGSGQPLDNCTVTDPDGIRTVRIRNTETDQQQASFSFGCANPTTSFTFRVPAGTRYKVVVSDCSVPRVTTNYVLRPNGSVVRPAPPPTSTVPGTTTSTSTSTPSTAPTSTNTTTTTTLPPSPVTTPNIFLGYADTEHDPLHPQPLPDPWLGDPGVTFLGCTSPAECGEYDAGAIRIDNPVTNPPLTLIEAYVDIETCHFAPWVALLPATVGPGGMLILTQTGVLGPSQPAPCNATMSPSTWPLQNFDTSEGPFDTLGPPAFFNCDPNLVDPPVITLVFEGGMVLTITDAAKVLNTGGFDRFACLGVSEATPWTAVDPANIARQN